MRVNAETSAAEMYEFEGENALVLANGRIEIQGMIYDSLSLSAIHLRHRNTNGWTWWLVDEKIKKNMGDLRQEYRSIVGSEISAEDLENPNTDDLSVKEIHRSEKEVRPFK